MKKKIHLPVGGQATKNFKQTQKLGENLARVIASLPAGRQGAEATKQSQKGATVLALSGNLGGGKTTFLQGFAKGLGIKEKILSPTFVILKHFVIPAKTGIQSFYHIDCYRINKPEEILELGWKEIISDPKNIVAIEWPEKIKKYLPRNCIEINFKFIDENKREIQFFEKGV